MGSSSSTSAPSAGSSTIKLPDPVTGPWTLADLKAGRLGSPKHGLRVFTTFHCGGGSSMGYKLAGFDVVGGVEIDPQMMRIYRRNHEPDPRLSFEMPIGEFNRMFAERPIQELVGVDVLDGSPPCSTFSISGSREDVWGVKKKFREGQSEQVLSDLFFEFIKTAELLKPRIIIAENVKGMLLGNARGYCSEVVSRLKTIGYDVQLFLLNSSLMGVPQRRERVFFIARRTDQSINALKMDFNERPIGVAEAIAGAGGYRKPLSAAFAKWWQRTPPGEPFSFNHPKKSFFNSYKMHPNRPSNTIASTTASMLAHWSEPVKLSANELIRLQSFPSDYDFMDCEPRYVLGMSVPPLMMQRIALVIAKSLLENNSMR